MAKIKLYHPRYESMTYGQRNEIQFGLKGGFEPHHAIVDEDDPLVAALLEAEPEVVVVQPAGPAQVFLCADHPDKEFKTKNALLTHLRAKGHGGAPVEAPEA